MAPADAEAVIDTLFKYPRFFVDHMMGACFCLMRCTSRRSFWVGLGGWVVGRFERQSRPCDARPNSFLIAPAHTHSLRTPPPPLHHRPLHGARGRHRPFPARGGYRPPDPFPGKLAGDGGGLGVQVRVGCVCWVFGVDLGSGRGMGAPDLLNAQTHTQTQTQITTARRTAPLWPRWRLGRCCWRCSGWSR